MPLDDQAAMLFAMRGTPAVDKEYMRLVNEAQNYFTRIIQTGESSDVAEKHVKEDLEAFFLNRAGMKTSSDLDKQQKEDLRALVNKISGEVDKRPVVVESEKNTWEVAGPEKNRQEAAEQKVVSPEVEKIKEAGPEIKAPAEEAIDLKEEIVKSPEEARLIEARGKYIKTENRVYQEHKKKNFIRRMLGYEIKDENKELETARHEHNEAINKYGKSLLEKKAAELEKNTDLSPEDKFLQLREYAQTNLLAEMSEKEERQLSNLRLAEAPPEQQKWFKQSLVWFSKMGRVQRLLLSTAVASGVALSFGWVGATSVGAYAAYRGGRSLLGMGAGYIAGGLADSFYKNKREGIKKESDIDARLRIENIGKFTADKSLENIMNVLEEQAAGSRLKLMELARLEKRHNLYKGIVTALTAGSVAALSGSIEKSWAGGSGKITDIAGKQADNKVLSDIKIKSGIDNPTVEDFSESSAKGAGSLIDKSATGAPPGQLTPEQVRQILQGKGMGSVVEKLSGAGKGLDLSVADLEKIPGTGSQAIDLTVGSRGPEGAIVDYFRGKPEMAKYWGWDCKSPIDQWAGAKAHQLWLNLADGELKKPEILAELKELGYPADLDGYAKMMQRIGQGTVKLFDDEKIGLVDTHFLKSVPTETSVPGAGAAAAEPIIESPPSSPAGAVDLSHYDQSGSPEAGIEGMPISKGDLGDIATNAPSGGGAAQEGLAKAPGAAVDSEIPTKQGDLSDLAKEPPASGTKDNLVDDWKKAREGVKFEDKPDLPAWEQRVSDAVQKNFKLHPSNYEKIKFMTVERFLRDTPKAPYPFSSVTPMQKLAQYIESHQVPAFRENMMRGSVQDFLAKFF
ncbi:MAG: hypothetical protein UV36_C0037G0003 [Parcubacteria group bacterium GW2011_GWC2_42_6]|nr:MAG: hypothetical protein UV36_C0037G0003 [Parcubacteria group bacterium GW2011_GWC2_42_6]